MKAVQNDRSIEEIHNIYKNEEVVVALHENTDAPMEPPVARFQDYRVRQSDVHKKQMFKSILKQHESLKDKFYEECK